MSPAALAAGAGFVIGLLFGASVQRTGFCLTRALHGAWLSGDLLKLRAFALAAAVALIGSQLLHAAGVVDLGRSLYFTPGLPWLALLLGGLLFGYGMVMANACGARSLVLLGAGNLRAFVVLVCLGMSAYWTLSGILAPARLWLGEMGTLALSATLAREGLPGLLSAIGLPVGVARWLLVAALALPLLWFSLASASFRASPRDVAGGLLVGLLIPAGWLATGWLGADDFEPVPPASLTFVAPVGAALQYLMLYTGTTLVFGVAVVGGVLAGALAAALASSSFRLEGFDSPARMLRSMAGGVLMGTGGVLALGCSIGQGLTGLSTLSPGTALALPAIVLGASVALRGPLRLPAS